MSLIVILYSEVNKNVSDHERKKTIKFESTHNVFSLDFWIP